MNVTNGQELTSYGTLLALLRQIKRLATSLSLRVRALTIVAKVEGEVTKKTEDNKPQNQQKTENSMLKHCKIA